MQARKHAAPALPDSFFARGVAVPPPGFGATCEAAGTMLAMDAPNLPAPLATPRARLVSAGRVMATSAMTAIPMVRYMSDSLIWKAPIFVSRRSCEPGSVRLRARPSALEAEREEPILMSRRAIKFSPPRASGLQASWGDFSRTPPDRSVMQPEALQLMGRRWF